MRQWLWCLSCERAFPVELGRAPAWGADDGRGQGAESPFDFTDEIEAQAGKPGEDGLIYAKCPYDGCNGDLLGFLWWERYRQDHPGAPEHPEVSVVYPND